MRLSVVDVQPTAPKGDGSMRPKMKFYFSILVLALLVLAVGGWLVKGMKALVVLAAGGWLVKGMKALLGRKQAATLRPRYA
jgi:hypothetical protein